MTDETGTISSLASADYVKLAHDAGREVWGLIDNFNEAFDETTDLAYASVRSRIIEQLLAEAASCGMDGINVDFENLEREPELPHYLQFLRELTSAAHAQNLWCRSIRRYRRLTRCIISAASRQDLWTI